MRLKASRYLKSRIILIAIFVTSTFLLAPSVLAWDGDTLGRIIGWIIGLFISALGLVLILVIKGLLLIATYQHFIDSQAVIEGWAIVRDLSNMFFVVILLVIAFSTILHLENYSYKKWLPKLILMAVLINFSKTICGLLIDVAQIVMLTFVNAFKDIAGGNIIDMLGIKDIVTMAKNTEGVGFWTIVGAYVLGLIYMIVALVVITTMMMMLVMRLVMIWIYVVLSPLAYLLAAFPGGAQYSSKWWKDFTQNLIVGPVLAFFIWLSFAALQTGNELDIVQTASNSQAGVAQEAAAIGSPDNSGDNPVAANQASTPSALIKFVIGIGMLIGGLKIAQEIGGAAGSIAGKGMGKLSTMGAATAGFIGGAAAFAVKQPITYGVDKLHQKTGVDLNVGRVISKMKETQADRSQRRYLEGQTVADRKMKQGGTLAGIAAISGNPKDAYNNLTTARGWRNLFVGGRRMARKSEKATTEKENLEKEAERDMANENFELNYMKADPQGRSTMRQDAILNRQIKRDEIRDEELNKNNLENELNAEKSKRPELQDADKISRLKNDISSSDQKINDLKSQDDDLSKRQRFMRNNLTNTYSPTEIEDKEISIKEKQKKYSEGIEKHQKDVNRNIPEYAFEARAAESDLVGKEMSKIKEIDDASELLRALQSSIKNKEKAMVKAIMLKLSKDGNDNEFLQPLAGRTDYKGLQGLMRDISDPKSKNYAGFDQQEAFALGSQIAEINKGTHHWDATHAFEMKNGKWQEMDDKTHAQYTDAETSKIQLQEMMRKFNRLAYGRHDANGKFHISANGFINLKKIDSDAGHKNTETMNINAIRFLKQAIEENPQLKAHFSQNHTGVGTKSLLDKFNERIAASQGFDKDYEDSFNYLK